MHGIRSATHVRQLHLRRTAYASTPVQQYLVKLPTKTSDHFDKVFLFIIFIDLALCGRAN